MSLMAIWGIVQWQAIENIFFNTAKSLVVITISAIVIYLIQSLLLSKETNAKHQEQKSTS
jgi:hypothetical protein